MLRTGVEERLREANQTAGRLLPAYDSYCFGNVPATIRSVLDAGGRRPLPEDVFEGVDTDVSNVVVVLVDGYGLHTWKRDRGDHAFLDRLSERGTVTPLTSVYPSETAAAITTFETGQLPCEHGRIGWNVYEPATDRSFVALGGDIKHDGGDARGGNSAIAPETDDGIDYHYADMAARGVDCHRLQPIEEQTEGVTQHTYDGLDDFQRRLSTVVTESGDPAYVYGYVSDVDHVSHEVGSDSDEFQATLATVCAEIEAFVDGLDETTAEETLLVVTADHGHVDTVPESNVDLSNNETLLANLRRYGDGTPIRLAGSPRNTHLHLQDGTVEATRSSLAGLDAWTFTRQEALERELFGDRPASDRFQRRCGDLVVTHRDLGTWWGDIEAAELELVGMHGGLHPHEMLVPFAAVRADRLQ
jgi:predicted AlkP superfamily pyrophosphatase or phosphodiesterase